MSSMSFGEATFKFAKLAKLLNSFGLSFNDLRIAHEQLGKALTTRLIFEEDLLKTTEIKKVDNKVKFKFILEEN